MYSKLGLYNFDKITSDLAYIAIGGVTLTIISIETWLIPYIKEFRILKSDEGKDFHLPELDTLVKETINDLKLNYKKKNQIKFYLSQSNCFNHNGGFHLSKGAIVGIPYWFIYNSYKDVKIRNFSEVNLNFEQTETLEFCQSLILSKNAKKFALAKEAYFIDFGDAYVKIFSPSLAGLISLAIYNAFIERFDLSLFPYYKLSLYILAIIFSLNFYVIIKKIAHEYIANYSTRRAASISNEYAEGGLEYFIKQIAGKKALKAMFINDKVKDKFFNDNYPLNHIKLIENIINDNKKLEKE